MGIDGSIQSDQVGSFSQLKIIEVEARMIALHCDSKAEITKDIQQRLDRLEEAKAAREGGGN